MPIIIPDGLVSEEDLEKDHIFTMEHGRAGRQDIRPLKLGLVNLMPKKEETEVQFLSLLSSTPLQVDLDLIAMKTYKPHNSSLERLKKYYKTYDEIKEKKYDGLIITGAPLENISYRDVVYREELTEIFKFAKRNVFSTMFICRSALAGLDYFYGVKADLREKKIFGVGEFEKTSQDPLLLGFDDHFFMPQSRYSYLPQERAEGNNNLKLLVGSDRAGATLLKSTDNRFIFNLNHLEYDRMTLDSEYKRDRKKGMDTDFPTNYYLEDDPKKGVVKRWKSTASLFFSNRLNFYVYQNTPYELEESEFF